MRNGKWRLKRQTKVRFNLCKRLAEWWYCWHFWSFSTMKICQYRYVKKYAKYKINTYKITKVTIFLQIWFHWPLWDVNRDNSVVMVAYTTQKVVFLSKCKWAVHQKTLIRSTLSRDFICQRFWKLNILRNY